MFVDAEQAQAEWRTNVQMLNRALEQRSPDAVAAALTGVAAFAEYSADSSPPIYALTIRASGLVACSGLMIERARGLQRPTPATLGAGYVALAGYLGRIYPLPEDCSRACSPEVSGLISVALLARRMMAALNGHSLGDIEDMVWGMPEPTVGLQDPNLRLVRGHDDRSVYMASAHNSSVGFDSGRQIHHLSLGRVLKDLGIGPRAVRPWLNSTQGRIRTAIVDTMRLEADRAQDPSNFVPPHDAHISVVANRLHQTALRLF
jgi:hypothetical protein